MTQKNEIQQIDFDKIRDKQVREYKRIVREIINNYLNLYEVNILAEANFCFDSATKLFKEMHDLGKIRKMEG